MQLRGFWISAMMVAGITACGGDDTTGNGDNGDAPDTAPADTAAPFDVDTTVDTAPPDTVTPDTADTTVVFDTAAPDVTSDTALPDTSAPGGFGAACLGNVDCNSGYCVEGPTGYVCTRTCENSCIPGWDCKGVAGETDVVFLCLPRLDKLCVPCLDDLQCNGGRCMDIDGELRCARTCDAPADCPSGFACEEGDGGGRCVPDTGSCTCFGEFDGGLRSCRNENGFGTCFGIQDCDPTVGWGACGARTPAAEVCNAQDDDCDAFLDEDVATVGAPCEVAVGGVGSCPGTTVCAGAAGLQCQGPTPTPETCDFEDDDCDGQVDEEFKTGAVYTAFDHCGSCNRSCAIGFPNAAQTACQVDQGVAQCVVVACEPGYIKQNDFQCIPDIVNLCEPCSEDANCLGQGSACVTLADGSFCAKACGGDLDCPTGFSCQTVLGETSKQCLPTTGVCSCGPATLGLSRACSVTVSPAGQPATTCAGSETCGAGGWGACVLPAETCNGFDDDCDGTVDDGFKNASGKYDRVANCGACGISCLALSFVNADPICDASGSGAPQCGFSCDSGWVDVDGLPGCECRPTSTTDLPDRDGIDANCDGIDGEIGKAIFVAKTGDDAGLGTIDDPLRTLQEGIDRAAQTGKRDVLVATGVYVESITLEDKVNVYGGYAPDFAARDRFTHESAILGVEPSDALRGAVNAQDIALSAADALVFDGFTVFGADNPAAGGSSYAVYLRDVGPHLTVSNNTIYAGSGGNGSAGAKGTDGARGVDGDVGVDAESVGSTCTSVDHASGGDGGDFTCEGTDTSGGAGGTRICPSVSGNVQTEAQISAPEEHGADGANNDDADGVGGEAGWDDKIQNSTECSIVSSSNSHDSFGAIGLDGTMGTHGLAGAACAAGAGTVGANGQWVPPAPGSATPASHGGGAGGGGAAGGIDHRGDCVNPRPYVVGGSGGGGGSGGCRGQVGQHGGPGGGSFAIFIAYAGAPTSLPTLKDNTIIRGRGGAGGAGGAGGVGGGGGFGAAGGGSGRGTGGFPLSCCGSGGGAGGNGGSGGHGAGGAGGCGGPAYGIYLAPVALAAPRTTITGNTLATSGAGGTGGPGGTSLGNPGPTGGSGANTATNY